MRRLRQWVIRLMTTMTRRHDDSRVREDIDDHIALETDENLRRGLRPDEARRRALLTFGSTETFKENCRDQQGLPALEHLLQDVRVSLRRMWKTPGFTGAAVAMMALGLGLTTAVMSLAYAVFLRPLPVDDPTRVVFVEKTRPNRPGGWGYSYPDYLYFREQARGFAELAAQNSTMPPLIVDTPGGPVGVSGAVVTANFFALLRLTPRAGRFFSADEDRVPGRDAVAVLGYDFWRTRFAEDPNVIGANLRINGRPFTVVGIAPERFDGIMAGLEPNDVFIPTAMYGVASPSFNCDAPLSRSCGWIGIVGRLAEGTSIDHARDEVARAARHLKEDYPEADLGNGVLIRPIRGIRSLEQITTAPIVLLLASAAGLVLLVVSANVAGLLLARGLRRRKEIAVRLAIGASRGRLIRLLLVESVTLAVVGSLAGLLIASLAADLLRAYFSNTDLSLDPRIALIGLGVALVTGVATGIAPALQSTRPDMALAMKVGTAGAGRPRSRALEGLIVLQVALSVLLLSAGGLLVRSFVMIHRGAGFDPDRVAIVRLRPSLVGFTTERAWAYQREVIERLEALPGVLAASPASAPASRRAQLGTAARLAGDSSDASHTYQVGTAVVGPRYFETLGAGVVEGREFDSRDRMDGPRVAIVNQTLAKHFWPNGGSVGSHLIVGSEDVEIVGVVKDLQWTSAGEQPAPAAYLNFWQQDRSNRVAQDSRTHVRVSGDASAFLPQIKRSIDAIDPRVPISEPGSLTEGLDAEYKNVRAARAMLVTLGGLALGLSMIGLYAALAFLVGERTGEIAVRLAIGASRADVGSLIFRRGMAIVLLGIVAGVSACVIAGPFLAHLLYGVSPHDPVAIGAGPLLLIVIAPLAVLLPTRRAMKQKPIVALRAE